MTFIALNKIDNARFQLSFGFDMIKNQLWGEAPEANYFAAQRYEFNIKI